MKKSNVLIFFAITLSLLGVANLFCFFCGFKLLNLFAAIIDLGLAVYFKHQRKYWLTYEAIIETIPPTP